MEFADDCGVHYQALYLNECGVYPTILPAIASYLRQLDEQGELEAEYTEFRAAKRTEFGEGHNTDTLPPPVGTTHPFIEFRVRSLKMSRAALAKRLCVHPAGLYRLELGQMKHLPSDVRDAMLVAGFPGTLVDELDYRTEEWNSGAWQKAAS